jgi:predicted ATPase
MFRVLFLLFLVTVFFSCKEKQVKSKSGYHLERKKMVTVLTDIVLAEGNDKVLKKYGYNSGILLDSSYQFIYKKQNIKNWQMDSSFKFYSNHPEDFASIVEEVIENLNRLEN